MSRASRKIHPHEPQEGLQLLSATRRFSSGCGRYAPSGPGLPDPELFDPLREERIRNESSAAAEMRPREIELDPLSALLLGGSTLIVRVV
jgi:hypothetical protein